QVVLANSVRMDGAVAPEHDNRDAAGLDLVHQPAGEMLWQRRKGDHSIAWDRRHASIEFVLITLVGEGLDQPDLAAHVPAPGKQRRADDQDIGTKSADQLGRLPVDAAIDMDLPAVDLVAEQI